MSDIQKDDVPEKIYEDEQYIVNDEGQVVAVGTEETSEEAKNGKDAKAKLPEIHISEVAIITCQEDLDRVLSDHNEWANAVLNPKADTAKGRANLVGADLRPYDLSGKNLAGANLTGANLQGVELVNANLTATNFERADLRCASLRGARLIRTKLTGADLRGADLTGALLMSTDLTTALTRSEEEPKASAADADADLDAPQSDLAAQDDNGVLDVDGLPTSTPEELVLTQISESQL